MGELESPTLPLSGVRLEVSYETISERIFNLSERGVVRGPGQSLLETYNERLELYKRYAD